DGWPALVADLLVAPRVEAPPLCLPTRAGGEAHVLGDLRRAPREALKLALIMIDDSHQILHEALQHAKSLVCLLVLQVGGGSRRRLVRAQVDLQPLSVQHCRVRSLRVVGSVASSAACPLLLQSLVAPYADDQDGHEYCGVRDRVALDRVDAPHRGGGGTGGGGDDKDVGEYGVECRAVVCDVDL